MRLSRVLVVFLIGAALVVALKSGWLQYLSFSSLKEHQAILSANLESHPTLFRVSYFFVYILVAALSLPGAAALTLAGGFLFGVWEGCLLVSFASTLGATAAFLSSRFLLRESVEKRFAKLLAPIQQGVARDGAFYLLSLRMVPLFPFFVVNLAMGVMPIRPWTFYWVSQLGMLPGTCAYVNAGTQLSTLESPSQILSPSLIIAFSVLGLFPLVSRVGLSYAKKRKVYRGAKRPKTFDYNVVVIGAGSAGLVTSYIASAVKARVALIEKHRMGGDCLNTGCVPSKALIRSAKILSYVKRARDFGLKKAEIEFEFSDVMARVKRVIAKVEPHDSVERYTKLGVQCLRGEAKILDPFRVSVNGQTLTTKNIVIATGASPLVPKIPGLEKIKYLTSDSLWGLNELPKRLLVLGGGPIGCELAQAFARLGSQVTQVEMGERILAREDVEVSAFVQRRFESEGIRVLTSHKAVEFTTTGTDKFLSCESPHGKISIPFDEVLLALGRKANTHGFGLENLGVALSPRGTVAVDDYLRTSIPNIYACGDVAGPYQFTHTAAHQAWYAAVNALFSPLASFRVDYRVIPWTTFVDPEVARVGLNELEAQEKSIPYEVTHYGIDDLDRAIAEEEDHGFVKVLTAPGTDKILGVTIVGAHAGDTIAEYVTAMKYGLGLNKILGTIHIYPTFAESNKYAAGLWKKAHAPQRLLSYVERFHSLRRKL